jgi:hypothetical protein
MKYLFHELYCCLIFELRPPVMGEKKSERSWMLFAQGCGPGDFQKTNAVRQVWNRLLTTRLSVGNFTGQKTGPA